MGHRNFSDFSGRARKDPSNIFTRNVITSLQIVYFEHKIVLSLLINKFKAYVYSKIQKHNNFSLQNAHNQLVAMMFKIR